MDRCEEGPTAEGIRLSASDLANHLACRHLTALDLAVAHGRLRPPVWRDPALVVLQQRGVLHERSFVEHLRSQELVIVELEEEGSPASSFERTGAAMRSGAEVIVQATLVSGRWLGRADVLLRVDRPSALGAWSYVVIDTKLARETRAGTILQLSLYSEIVGEIQGILPEYMYVVPPGRGFEPETFRVHDFLAYYRFVKQRLEEAVDHGCGDRATYPEPTAHCDICRWWSVCDGKRREDDHLSFVAGISKLQRRELQTWNVTTLEGLATLSIPLQQRPRRGASEGYVRMREQARLQLEGRNRNEPVYELLPREPERGLARLPVPSRGDMFFDIEGDPFVGEHGLEYLFGYVALDESGEPQYHWRWGLGREEERIAFGWFVDAVLARWSRFPDLHIYHFAPYEPVAIKRLMGRHSWREDEVDRMLRAGLFVDLYSTVKQSVRAGVERYSIKDLEAFYSYGRTIPLREASANLRRLEMALELDQAADVGEETLEAVRAYNRDDCMSAIRLRDWLECLRSDLVDRGEEIARRGLQIGDPSEFVDERQRRVDEVKTALLRGVSTDPAARSTEQHSCWVLAELLDWHRRESKAPWWEYFRLRDLAAEELLHEKAALSGLAFVDRVGGTEQCPIDRYRYPPQDTELREGDSVHTGNLDVGIVHAINFVGREVDIKKRGAAKDVHPDAIFAHSIVSTAVLSDALLRLGKWITDHGIDAAGKHRAARDLLLNKHPRIREGSQLRRDGEDTVAAARRLALVLDGGVLPIQGPPGAGKTYTGARMICELVQAGRTVGVTAVSHKVIRNLLDTVVDAAREEGIRVQCIEKVADKPSADTAAVQEVSKNEQILAALSNREADVAGATAWLWARQEFLEAVDVLFVDEAGQMSLADVLAVSQAARSVVLLGDPQQLEQPQQGSHPEGTNVSALEYLLGVHKTIPTERGLFLEETWRLHPAICALTSELFYENRLRSRQGLERQALLGDTCFAGAGLWFVPVLHEGNQSCSAEEVERVAELVNLLIRVGVSWTDREGCVRPLQMNDVLIVAPYNAQVADIGERLPGARVGTVDKFQGQEAPVVIYSMTTSSPEEAPRGMEFLYSLNRLNVATSRGRCACILIANPRLFEPECKSPRQMQLANAFCRYVELARIVNLP